MKNLTISQKYKRSFFLIAFLPILCFTLFFYFDYCVKFDQWMHRLLRTGLIFIDHQIQETSEGLHLTTDQIIPYFANLDKQTISSSVSRRNMAHYLTESRKAGHFDFAMVYNAKGQLLTAIHSPVAINPPKFQQDINSALMNHPIATFRRLYKNNSHQLDLCYYTVSPLISNDSRMMGILVVGKFFEAQSQLSILSKISSGNIIRIIIRPLDGESLVDAAALYNGKPFMPLSQSLLTATLKENLVHYLHKPVRITPGHFSTFKEKISHRDYVTSFFPLRNYENEVIGFIAFSLPLHDKEEVIWHHLILNMAFLVLGAFLVFRITRSFKRNLAEPIEQLSWASQQIARGNLNQKLTLPNNVSEDILGMLQNFNDMIDELSEKESLRDIFIATLTHDLKTPVLAQKRVIDILEEEFEILPSDERLYLLHALAANNHHMLDMIQSLLDVYTYKEGQFQLHCRQLDLFELIEKCFTQLGPLAFEKSIQFQHELSAAMFYLWGDFQYLERVFSNLIVNAIENIQRGGRITISAERLESRIEIQIADNGPGIEPQFLSSIFQRYSTGRSLRKKIGTGLGLYICKMIIEEHRGSIDVESTPPFGSVFIISLPDSFQGHTDATNEAGISILQ